MLKPLIVWITTNWKILKEMGISDHLTCLLRNMYVGQEATVWLGHGTTVSKLGKEYIKAVYCHLAYLIYAEYIMWNARLDDSQSGIKFARRNINNLIHTNGTTLWAESKELKSYLRKVKQESEKAELKFSIQKRRSWHPVPSLYGK